MRPELVLADEPTGNLDTRSSAEVLELLAELNRDEGHTIVLVTHDPSAAATAGRVLFLRDGRVAGEIEGGSTQQVSDSFTGLEGSADGGPPQGVAIGHLRRLLRGMLRFARGR
jgi:putative ABC transport system ATP-binding protein